VVCTLNASRVLRATATLLRTNLEGLSELALRSTPGAHGLVLLPYLDGERTPPLPHAAGTLSGLRRESMYPEHLARAAVEGMLCGLADALDVLRGRGVVVRRVFLVGTVAHAPVVQQVAPLLFGVPVVVPAPGDYAARGAARQAAWALAGGPQPPQWPLPGATVHEAEEDLAVGTAVRQQFASVREQTHPETGGVAGTREL
jgi:xylulokinase